MCPTRPAGRRSSLRASMATAERPGFYSRHVRMFTAPCRVVAVDAMRAGPATAALMAAPTAVKMARSTAPTASALEARPVSCASSTRLHFTLRAREETPR